ncbi:transcription factor HIVEP2a [Cololabis saira]|uniref:transcription factor HIVEP2a n=1 Tax=Cololabis saira TaxID=129043 RepID=UPI002AD2B7E1|nr:transcription factor HIVEP2a [Cololabis saira]XP_061563070.1 transcription factor HIVEP2a [Cololabis saira]
METRDPAAAGQKCSNRDYVKEKVPLQRKWASEPSANTKRNTFADPDVKHRESLPCGATGGSAPHHKYAIKGNSAKLLSGASAVGAIGGSQDPQGPFAQGFHREYSYQLGQPYPQHPQTERFVSGAKPPPGLEPHAWPFAGQLPLDDLYPVGHPGHTHPHGAGPGRFPRQKSPSLPSSFGQYSQSGGEPGEEGYSKKEQKPKKLGKYKCNFCGRLCAKPSVLKKHIRSHTGERPYPCEPCGFSFKTKSNLYKHRKSHAHAIKAGLVPFSSELAVHRSGDMDHASPAGDGAEAPSDGEQSTDTDEEGVDGSTMLTDKDSPIPQISFEADKHSGGVEPAYADSAEELPMGSMKVPILIFPKSGGIPPTGLECPPFHDIKGSHHMLASQAGGRSQSLDDSPTIRQRLALRLNEKKGQDSDPGMSQSLNLLSPHSKGSTDSGYFSPFDSAELQIGTPNANVKTYEEIMFGRTWYNRPNSRSRQPITVGMAMADPNSLVSLKQPGPIPDMGKIAEDHISYRGNQGICGDAKQYPTGPCQSSTGLLEPPSDSGPLFRSNSMPTPSPPNLSAPQGIRGSVSFDNMVAPDDVFYPPGHPRLKRQSAFEHSANEAHVGEACEGYGHVPKGLASSMGVKVAERGPGGPEHLGYGTYGTKVSLSEIATRKRRKEKSVGDDEDSPGNCDSSCSGSVEMLGDYELKHGSFDGSRATPTGKGSLHSAHSQSDSFETCTSMCSEDLYPDAEGRKAVGNVISVIQHTNSLSRPNSFEKSESFEQPGYQPSDKAPSSQYSEQSDTDIFEDALSPESALLRTESMEQQLQSDSDLASLSSSSAAPSPGQPFHKLVRQPNIQVPEIRVTEEPDKPEKDADAPAAKEPEKPQHVEEFQLPQRSDTLSQMPTEKLPPKKKRLRLADMEHSSGESSFESTCTSLSRSPSQESNLSHSSSLSMSFDRDEGLKSVSPTKQEDSGSKASEFLTVPGSGYSSHHQQREMRRSSSEQAPCTLPTELPEMRSKSFDYGSLPSSRQGELYSSASAKKERRRGYLVRQASLSVYPEAVLQEPGGAQVSIKQESLELGTWPSPTGSPHGGTDVVSRAKRAGGSHHHQHLHHQSISEDSLQDEPPYGRSQLARLQAQGSSSEGEYPGHEAMNKDLIQQYQSGPPFISISQPGLFWSQDSEQTPRQQPSLQTQHQLQKLHSRPPGHLPAHSPLKQIHNPQPYAEKSENPSSLVYSSSLSSRGSPLSQQQNVGMASSKLPLPSSNPSQPAFATQGSLGALPGCLVPVRIQTHVPLFGSAMYTSVSHLIASHRHGATGLSLDDADGGHASHQAGAASIGKPPGGVVGGMSGTGFNLSLLLGQTLWKSGDSPSEQHVNTGIPLSLTSGTISTTDASGSGAGGGGKRMLSPASSLELFIETKQQKRVKEERMYGQIVKEMSAVELSGTEGGTNPEKLKGPKSRLQHESSMDDSEKMSSSPPLSDFPSAAKIAIPVRSSAPQPSDVPRAESFTPPLQIVTDRSPVSGGRDSPEELDVDEVSPERNSSPEPMLSSNGDSGTAVGLLLRDAQQFFQFPSLRTMTKLSWCFRNYTKPNSSQVALRGSVYASWCVSSYNPNPLNLSTKAALALLRSKQRTNTDLMYTTAAKSPPSSGKLVSSVAWKLRFDQLKQELMPVEVGHYGRKMKGVVSWDRSKDEQVEKEVSVKQAAEPTRIKIFEGGYKSNEDYVYVRGRGRGKYICEECGIRCKKPSMLKKHIRTHTDVRPYVCKFCNFAFKTKGNLTKHMKSKAHMKKCLELGVSMSSVEDGDADEGDGGEDGPRCSEKPSRDAADHQFSDADDSDGGDEDGDEVDEDDEEDDEYDGDSTPKTRSRSTSPSPFSLPSLSVTAVAAAHPAPGPAHDLLGGGARPPLFGYFTTVPSIRITPQAPPGDPAEYQRGQQRLLGSRLLVPSPSSSSMDEDLPSPDPSSRLSSPGLDLSGCPSPASPSSSPSARRYLSPRRDLSPRHLSPRRDVSPLRHPSPKRELGGGYRRDLSPRRRHLSVISPLSRPTSPGGRDYKRDLSPQGRHRGVMRPVSPCRGLHQHLHLHSQQGGARGSRTSHQGEFAAGRQRAGADMETEHGSIPPLPGERGRGTGSGPPHQVLFSHLPLHSQLQVRSPFPMVPIGGIQMVHSVPASVTGAPLGPAGGRDSPSAGGGGWAERPPPPRDGDWAERPPPPRDGGGGWAERPPPPRDGGGARLEQEEIIHTCTKAIASLCIATAEGGGGRGADGKEAPAPAPGSTPPPPPHPGPGIQHFSGLEPPYPTPPPSSSPRPPSPGPDPPHPPERDRGPESTK